MVQSVFGRIPADCDPEAVLKEYAERQHGEDAIRLSESPTEKRSSQSSSSDQASVSGNSPSLDNLTLHGTDPKLSASLESIYNQEAFDHPNASTTIMKMHGDQAITDELAPPNENNEFKKNTPQIRRKPQDLYYDTIIKDAYLVFRALCKLSMKGPSGNDSATDVKSSSFRSKLLALVLIHKILKSYIHVFFAPAPALFTISIPMPRPFSILYIYAVRQYLCLVFTRNVVNVVPYVFDLSMDIFGEILYGLRTVLKKEILVIFTEVILPLIEAKTSSTTFHQRISLLQSLGRIFAQSSEGGKVLIELYLNYDCDVNAKAHENLWERLVTSLARVMTGIPDGTPNDKPLPPSTITPYLDRVSTATVPLTVSQLVPLTKEQTKELYSPIGDLNELRLRLLDLLVGGILKPLASWCDERAKSKAMMDIQATKKSLETLNELSPSDKPGLGLSMTEDSPNKAKMAVEDDPAAFETLKVKKQQMVEGIRLFNIKPKKGIQLLLDSKNIPSRTPIAIAKFLNTTEGLNKSVLGEFLGEGNEENISIMHAFVDELDFQGLPFVDALRTFLQKFRLPGEAQKIDRFMLKFADRYLQDNPAAFSSADTAYVLAYSVIMLNTDQHNAQVKKRMTKADFLKNNRGIDEGKDIAAEILEAIFDEIQSNEIVMNDEVEKKENQALIENAAEHRKPMKNREKVTKAGEHIAQKTEVMFTNLMKPRSNGSQDGNATEDSEISSRFFTATHYEHVKPMFHLLWMSIMMVISTPLQKTEQHDVVQAALEGVKVCLHLAYFFDLELEQSGFMSNLVKWTSLNNINEIKPKHLEATKTLLDIAYLEGNHLHGNWIDVVRCVSQMEKFQLLSSDEVDLAASRSATDAQKRNKEMSKPPRRKTLTMDDNAGQLTSQSMSISVDRLFTSSAKLSAVAITEFIRALCDMSWTEIKSSSDLEHPTMYCLQRLIEISFYNMNRIRVEWSQLWNILGAHFNQVGCQSNTNVAYFALDKLRQLAFKFLELDELSNFKFQKDFMHPFEEILANTPEVKIKDMVLVCLQQMIQARAERLKSGWKSIMATLMKSAKEDHAEIVVLSFDIVRSIFKNHIRLVIQNQTFADFVSCLVVFCNNQRFPKTCLQSVELLNNVIDFVDETTYVSSPHRLAVKLSDDPSLNSAGRPSSKSVITGEVQTEGVEENPAMRLWFPVLFGLYEIVMTCDLEVRTRALNYMFQALKDHGKSFNEDFWSLIFKGVLFPIFDDLRMSRRDHSKFANKEEMSVWLSTTLIQALRKMVELVSHHLHSLLFLFDDVLDLLVICMTQENETLSRIGSTCFQQLVESSSDKLDDFLWAKICVRIIELFDSTTPHELFFDTSPDDGTDEERLAPTGQPYSAVPQRADFQRIIVKCVLHLQVIQTLQELFNPSNENVYKALSTPHALILVDCLFRSYKFAQLFNSNLELRTVLFNMGFMKQLPNLLKQETSSASAYLMMLSKLCADTTRAENQDEFDNRLIPLLLNILRTFISLDADSKKRNVTAWKPVVQRIIECIQKFEAQRFERLIRSFYMPVVSLIHYDLPVEMRESIEVILKKAGVAFGVDSVEDDVCVFPNSETLKSQMQLLASQQSLADQSGSMEAEQQASFVTEATSSANESKPEVESFVTEATSSANESKPEVESFVTEATSSANDTNPEVEQHFSATENIETAKPKEIVEIPDYPTMNFPTD